MVKKTSKVTTLKKPALDKSTVMSFAGKKDKPASKPGEKKETPKSRLTLTMNKDLHYRLKLYALENGTNVTALLEQWTREKLG